MTIQELQQNLSAAHTEVMVAQEYHRLCARAMNQSDMRLAEACRNRYRADRDLQEALLADAKENPDFQI